GGKLSSMEGGVPKPVGFDELDPRFAAMYESSKFAIDPTDPRYKATDGMVAIMAERQKRRKPQQEDGSLRPVEKHQKNAVSGGEAASSKSELKTLVASLKRKTATAGLHSDKELPRPKKSAAKTK
ncbi:hypothetical protein CYMTET_8092, partial [Cymbomonas tetramitiformis]